MVLRNDIEKTCTIQSLAAKFKALSHQTIIEYFTLVIIFPPQRCTLRENITPLGSPPKCYIIAPALSTKGMR